MVSDPEFCPFIHLYNCGFLGCDSRLLPILFKFNEVFISVFFKLLKFFEHVLLVLF